MVPLTYFSLYIYVEAFELDRNKCTFRFNISTLKTFCFTNHWMHVSNTSVLNVWLFQCVRWHSLYTNWYLVIYLCFNPVIQCCWINLLIKCSRLVSLMSHPPRNLDFTILPRHHYLNKALNSSNVKMNNERNLLGSLKVQSWWTHPI